MHPFNSSFPDAQLRIFGRDVGAKLTLRRFCDDEASPESITTAGSMDSGPALQSATPTEGASAMRNCASENDVSWLLQSKTILRVPKAQPFSREETEMAKEKIAIVTGAG